MGSHSFYRQSMSCVFLNHSIFFLRQNLPLNLELLSSADWIASKPQGASGLRSQCWDWRFMPWLSVWAMGDPNPHPQACVSSAYDWTISTDFSFFPPRLLLSPWGKLSAVTFFLTAAHKKVSWLPTEAMSLDKSPFPKVVLLRYLSQQGRV